MIRFEWCVLVMYLNFKICDYMGWYSVGLACDLYVDRWHGFGVRKTHQLQQYLKNECSVNGEPKNGCVHQWTVSSTIYGFSLNSFERETDFPVLAHEQKKKGKRNARVRRLLELFTRALHTVYSQIAYGVFVRFGFYFDIASNCTYVASI